MKPWAPPARPRPAAMRAAALLAAALASAASSGLAAASPQPHPRQSRKQLYETRGAIEVDTNENTMFLWHGQLYVLENIPCYYSQHASRWFPAYANAVRYPPFCCDALHPP